MAGPITPDKLKSHAQDPYPSLVFLRQNICDHGLVRGPATSVKIPTNSAKKRRRGRNRSSPSPTVLKDEAIKPKMIMPLRPKRSVSAPPIAEPIKLETKKSREEHADICHAHVKFAGNIKRKEWKEQRTAEAVYKVIAITTQNVRGIRDKVLRFFEEAVQHVIQPC